VLFIRGRGGGYRVRFRYLAGPLAAPASGAPAAREGRPRLPAYAGEDGSGGGFVCLPSCGGAKGGLWGFNW
jgi:hypothetical protein